MSPPTSNGQVNSAIMSRTAPTPSARLMPIQYNTQSADAAAHVLNHKRLFMLLSPMLFADRPDDSFNYLDLAVPVYDNVLGGTTEALVVWDFTACGASTPCHQPRHEAKCRS